jgi:hypothetical protein
MLGGEWFPVFIVHFFLMPWFWIILFFYSLLTNRVNIITCLLKDVFIYSLTYSFYLGWVGCLVADTYYFLLIYYLFRIYFFLLLTSYFLLIISYLFSYLFLSFFLSYSLTYLLFFLTYLFTYLLTLFTYLFKYLLGA